MSDASFTNRAISWTGLVGTVALIGIPGVASATPVAPNGLAAGSNYRLVFVTQNTTPGTSSDIATYNAVATAAAATAGLSGIYKAVASTATVNAINNIACTPSCAADPIFLVTGAEVASSTANLFSGSIMTPIDFFANGTAVPFDQTYLWSGSTSAGVAGDALGTATPSTGFTEDTRFWLASGNGDATTSRSVYAISNELTVQGTAAPVPEPVTTSLLLVGLAGAAAARHRARHRA